MSFSIYQASAPVYVQGLKGLLIVLEKSKAFAKARKLDEALLLQTRLYPDMLPFARQVQIAADNAKGGVARLAGVEVPSYPDTETSFDELIARVEKTIAFVQGFKPADIDGSEDKEVVLKFPSAELKFTGASFLLSFSMPNFYFHLTTAYALMRHVGVEIGKSNFLARA